MPCPRRAVHEHGAHLRAEGVGKGYVRHHTVLEERAVPAAGVRSMSWSGTTMCCGSSSDCRLPTALTDTICFTPNVFSA